MPNSTSGMTGNEIVTFVTGWIGNYSDAFKTLVGQMLPMAEKRYCKAHTWRFLYKQKLALTVASGTDVYSLDIAGIGFNMPADKVESVWSIDNGIYLKKYDLNAIRRYDTKQNFGNANSKLQFWGPVNDNQIFVYPKVFADTSLEVDGWIVPTTLYDLTEYPTIPERYQDSFVMYVLALAADRENDDRAARLKGDALAMIKMDIQDDLSNMASSADSARIRSQAEAALDGVGGNAEQAWINSLFSTNSY